MKLYISRFLNDPTHKYASIIQNPQQLKIRHSHDYFELFMVNRGSAIHKANGEAQSISRGSIVLVRPEDSHFYERMSPAFQIINMLVPSLTMMSVFEYLGPSFQPERLLDCRLPVISNLDLDDYEHVLIQFEQLVLDNQIRGSRSDALFRFTLISVLFNCFPVNRAEGTSDIPSWLHGLCLEMMKEAHFVEGLPALYRIANKSKEHISRSFRRYLDRTPTDFINDLRLDASARKIVSTESKIVDICGEVGFDSVSHYYHLFLKKFGMSPKDFRNRAASGSLDENLIGVYPLDVGIPTGIPIEEN